MYEEQLCKSLNALLKIVDYNKFYTWKFDHRYK